MNRMRSNYMQTNIPTQLNNDEYISSNSQQFDENNDNAFYIPNQSTQIQTTNSYMAYNMMDIDDEIISEISYRQETTDDTYNSNQLIISESTKKRKMHEFIRNIRKEYDLKNNPHLKITVFKLNSLTNEKQFEDEYFLTPYGLRNSERNIDDFFVKIGRLLMNEKSEIQNDIILSDDRSISRCHCKIEYREGFKYIKNLPDEYCAFLMMNHPRLGCFSNVRPLPNHLLYNILSYLGNKRQFYIIDCGSVLGTYKKLKFNQPYQLKRTQIYSVGSESLIIVKEIYHCNIYSKLLWDYIMEQMKDGVIILGLSEDFQLIYENSTPQQRNLINFEFPSKTCIKIDICHYNPNEQTKS